jgi:hypothetical protein
MFRIGGFDGTDFEQQRFQHPLHAVIFHELRSRDDALRVKARACDGPVLGDASASSRTTDWASRAGREYLGF